MPPADVERTVEQVARASYGRLLAFLAARSRDVAAAEDALGDAFRSALEVWPRIGLPEHPESWLLVAARRRLIDEARRARVRNDARSALMAAAGHAQEMAGSDVAFPDERLAMMFVCAHPAIARAMRTPLMLQTVLGLDAGRIASAFLVRPSTMGQRLSRAKSKIRDTGIRFELPEACELPGRLNAVLEAIYACYGSGWDHVDGADQRRSGLAGEAVELGRLLVRFMPEEPEVLGLMALMLHCEARRDARRSERGAYVPLSEQDMTRWSTSMIEEAEACLRAAMRAGRIGRFQLEAAIQSAHARRAWSGRTDWESIALLYEGLVRLAPAIGALVGRAAAVAEAHGVRAGWKLLQEIAPDAVETYQPYWALAAHLLERMDLPAEAAAARLRAVGLCEERAVREFLLRPASRAE